MITNVFVYTCIYVGVSLLHCVSVCDYFMSKCIPLRGCRSREKSPHVKSHSDINPRDIRQPGRNHSKVNQKSPSPSKKVLLNIFHSFH